MAETADLARAFALGLALPFVWCLPAMAYRWISRGLSDFGGLGQ